MSSGPRGVAVAPPRPEAAAIHRAALGVADCRSLPALRDTLFGHADTVVDATAMGLYIFDDTNRLRYVASRRAPQGFLDQYDRELRACDQMLDCIVSERRAVDGFHFYGPGGWRRSGNYDLLRSWGFHYNMGGPLVVDGRTVGILFAATIHDTGPYEAAQVQRFALLCRAGSLALTAIRDRERLRCELSDAPAPESWLDYLRLGEPHGMGRSDLDPAPAGPPIDRLPPRAQAVARLLCEGHSNKAIASRLGISANTVKDHVEILCRRFGAVNRTDLVHRLVRS
jgi:DNA-binding CsgD family transcriptional regulator